MDIEYKITLISVIVVNSVTVLVAVLSLVSSLLNSRGSYRIKSSELFFNAMSESFCEYLSVTATLPYELSDSDLKLLNAVTSRAILYASKETQSIIGKYSQAMIDFSQSFSSAAPNIKVANSLGQKRGYAVDALCSDINSFLNYSHKRDKSISEKRPSKK